MVEPLSNKMSKLLYYCDFSELPPHILTQILLKLHLEDFKSASSVCKSWYYASTDPRITRTLTFQPNEKHFPKYCKSNRRFGILKLENLMFDQVDSYYFELFDKFCPFIYELHINKSFLQIHHLLMLLELTTYLEIFSFNEWCLAPELSSLFPVHYDFEEKNRIVKVLAGVKSITFNYLKSIPFIDQFVRYAINLETFSIYIDNSQNEDKKFCANVFKIFANDNIVSLKNLTLSIYCRICDGENFTNFNKIENLYLRLLQISMLEDMESTAHKGPLYLNIVLKLQTLVKFSIGRLSENQLSLICQHFRNLKHFEFDLLNCDQDIYMLENLQQLETLRCGSIKDHSSVTNFVAVDTFFKCKFENLKILTFVGVVTESNLVQLCENHPNLIELKLKNLLTENLEIIFKHLTKLRVLELYGFQKFRLRQITRNRLKLYSATDSDKEYEYKISRLKDLEELYLQWLVNGIKEDDVKELTKLHQSNLAKLFADRNRLCSNSIKS